MPEQLSARNNQRINSQRKGIEAACVVCFIEVTLFRFTIAHCLPSKHKDNKKKEDCIEDIVMSLIKKQLM